MRDESTFSWVVEGFSDLATGELQSVTFIEWDIDFTSNLENNRGIAVKFVLFSKAVKIIHQRNAEMVSVSQKFLIFHIVQLIALGTFKLGYL